MKQINHLRDTWETFNADYFRRELEPIRIMIKRSRRKDGHYEYRCRKNGTPIREELHRAVIVISEDLYKPAPDWGLIYGTLLHEMIHQYQTEVLNSDTDHGPIFKEMAETLEDATGYSVM